MKTTWSKSTTIPARTNASRRMHKHPTIIRAINSLYDGTSTSPMFIVTGTQEEAKQVAQHIRVYLHNHKMKDIEVAQRTVDTNTSSVYVWNSKKTTPTTVIS